MSTCSEGENETSLCCSCQTNKNKKGHILHLFLSLPQERGASILVPHLPLKDGSKLYYCDLYCVP